VIKVKWKWGLIDAPTTETVYVEGLRKLFYHDGHEWIEKRYFTVMETASIIGVSKWIVRDAIVKTGLRLKRNGKLNMSELLKVASIIEMRADMKYRDIKVKMKRR
jgi:hypothetical protein